MIPVPLDEFNSKNIRARLLELADVYKDEVNTFAVLLNDSKDHIVNMIIRNNDMWHALNNISGRHLHIFYFDVDENAKRVAREAHEAAQRERQQQHMKAKGMVFMMVGIKSPPNIDDSVSMLKMIVNEKIQSPAILFFQVSGDSIRNKFVVNIKSEQVEAAFLELKKIIEKAVKHIEQANPDADPYDFFTQLEDAIRINKFFDYFKGKFSLGFGVGPSITYTP